MKPIFISLFLLFLLYLSLFLTQTNFSGYFLFEGGFNIQETNISSWTIGSGGDPWIENINFDNTIYVRSTGNIELEQLVNDYLAYWRFDEGSGTIAHDETGEFNGTVKNNVTWIDGEYGKKIRINAGSEGYIYIPHNDALNLNNTKTYNYLNKEVRFYRNGTYYSNGFFTLEGNFPYPNENEEVTLGGRGSSPNINITLDDIRIYKRVLSESDVNKVMKNEHYSTGNITSIIKDAEDLSLCQVWSELKIEGWNDNDTWFHGYWNYSDDNVSYQLQDLGNLTPGTNYNLIKARYGSVIIELNTKNLSKTPQLYNITLYTINRTDMCLQITSP
jgi:hypothetical protein